MNSSAYVCTLEFIFTKSAQASRISKIGLPVICYSYNLNYKNNILHVPDNLSRILKKLRLNRSFFNGAEDEIRTRDVHLGKVTLYH